MVLLGVVIGKCEMPSTDISQENDHAINIGAFCLRMRENHSVRLQMADLLGGCEFCHGFHEKYGLNFCSISQNSC